MTIRVWQNERMREWECVWENKKENKSNKITKSENESMREWKSMKERKWENDRMWH